MKGALRYLALGRSGEADRRELDGLGLLTLGCGSGDAADGIGQLSRGIANDSY